MEFDADPRGFAERRHLDVAGLIREFNKLWKLKQKEKVWVG